MHANWPHKINDQINRKRQGLPDAGCQRGATAILLFVCMLSLFSTNCPNIIVLHSANTSELQATKKPHNYHKIAVWQKDDRIRKSPLKFYAHYDSILSGDCQASIITELWRLSVVFCVTLSRNCSLSLCKYAIINHPRFYQIFVQLIRVIRKIRFHF